MGQPVNPPDGWTPTSGVWGTDFQRDTTTYLTSGTSLKVVGTAANTQTVVGPWFPMDANSVAYVATAVFQSTNTTSMFSLKFAVYAADKSTLTDWVYLYNGSQAVPTANAWMQASAEFSSHSGCAWARWELTRPSGSTASLYFDRLEVKKLGPRWFIRKGASQGQTIVSGTPLTVNFPTSVFTNLVTVSGTSNTTITVYRAGLYMLQFRSHISGFTAGDTLLVQFVVTDPVLGAVTWGDTNYVAPTGGNIYVNLILMYRHAGTLGAGSPTSVKLSYTGAASPFVDPGPASPFNNDLTSLTSFTGSWLGLG